MWHCPDRRTSVAAPSSRPLNAPRQLLQRLLGSEPLPGGCQRPRRGERAMGRPVAASPVGPPRPSDINRSEGCDPPLSRLISGSRLQRRRPALRELSARRTGMPGLPLSWSTQNGCGGGRHRAPGRRRVGTCPTMAGRRRAALRYRVPAVGQVGLLSLVLDRRCGAGSGIERRDVVQRSVGDPHRAVFAPAADRPLRPSPSERWRTPPPRQRRQERLFLEYQPCRLLKLGWSLEPQGDPHPTR